MDSLVASAGRLLAAGDPLGALKRVALRNDPPAQARRRRARARRVRRQFDLVGTLAEAWPSWRRRLMDLPARFSRCLRAASRGPHRRSRVRLAQANEPSSGALRQLEEAAAVRAVGLGRPAYSSF